VLYEKYVTEFKTLKIAFGLSKNQVFGHKKSEKSTRIFLNTDFGREKNPLTGNTYIYQHKKFSKSVVPEL
jgi:hypothetical protein